jgi:hypothetical protein
MSEKLKITEIDVATGQVSERIPTETEKQEYNLAIGSQEQFDADLQARVFAKKSALSKLAALGLTEEEVAAL